MVKKRSKELSADSIHHHFGPMLLLKVHDSKNRPAKQAGMRANFMQTVALVYYHQYTLPATGNPFSVQPLASVYLFLAAF